MNRPRSQRRKRTHHQTWSGPLVSWTAAITRRQHERNNSHATNAIVSLILAKYFLIAAVLVYTTWSGSGPVTIELLRTLTSSFITLTAYAILFIVLWWFMPRLIWSAHLPNRAWIGHYPSPPKRWPDLLMWGPALLLIAFIFFLFSPYIPLILSIAVTGVWLILTGIRRRVGCDERCRCGYPVSTPRWSRGPCPECGRNLDRPRAIILGHDTRSPARIAVGLTTLALALLILWWRFAP